MIQQKRLTKLRTGLGRLLFASIVLASPLLYSISTHAQDTISKHDSTYRDKLYTTQTANLIGIGGTIIYDEYLSPLKYGGIQTSYFYSRLKRLSKNAAWIGHYQSALSLHIADNPAGNASYLGVMGDLSYAVQRKAYEYYNLRLYAGPALRIACGGIYSTRNGNNPATLKLQLDLMAQLLLSYRLPSDAFPALFRIDWQGSMLGTAFAAEYGESYYELFVLRKGIKDAMALTSPTNAFSQRMMITADLPVWNIATVRLGYSFSSLNSKLNNINNSWHNHSFLLGLVFEINKLKGRDAMNGLRLCPIL